MMSDLPTYRDSPAIPALAVVAVRFIGENRPENVAEYLVYDESSGAVFYVSKSNLIAYLEQSGSDSVICRDRFGGRSSLVIVEAAGERWLRTRPDDSLDDTLLSLVAFCEPAPGRRTVHLISVNYTLGRTRKRLINAIVRSDATGVARILDRVALRQMVSNGPEPIILHRPGIARRRLLPLSGTSDGVTAGDFEGEDALFAMPQHRSDLLR